MLTRRRFSALCLAAPAALAVTPALAATPPVFAPDGIAYGGTDPVAYFTDAAPVPGRDDITSDWMGVTVRFATEDNKAAFDADPEAYAPAYGGYCAYAVSKGATAPTDPEAWTIHEGRLYLNFSTQVREIWREDIPGNVEKADRNWPGVLE